MGQPVDLEGRVAIVTGSRPGHRPRYGALLAECGACVVVNDRDSSTAQSTAGEIVAAGRPGDLGGSRRGELGTGAADSSSRL